MNRLDYCKKELEKQINKNKPVNLVFQELNNMLPTYREKKELSEHLSKITKKN